MRNQVIHTIEPIFDKDSRILILGTMPSPKSREIGFYYSHPQNRFWRVMAWILDARIPVTNDEKEGLMLENNIALWDVLKSCDIEGAEDGSIKNPVPNDLTAILGSADIRAIFTTGRKAFELYRRHCYDLTKREAVYLPSTSPANCRYYTFENLASEYEVILKYLRT